jgi:putative ABC transport system permease protein
MSFVRNIASGLRSVFRRKQVDRELDEELGAYVEMAADEKMKQGMSRQEAFRTVRLERGSLDGAKEIVRSGGWESILETCWQDLRYGLRVLRKSPGFAAVAVLTLALGIGANTALFSVVNGVLLNPLPYPHPDQVVTVATWESQFGESSISYPDFQDWVRDNHSFSSLAAYKSFQSFNWIRQSDTQHISAVEVTAAFFPTLGVTPALGRNFTSAEDELNGPPAVILSSGLWKSEFASSSDVIGKTLNLSGTDYTIVGVLPQNFYFCCRNINFQAGDVYVTLGATKDRLFTDRQIHPGIYAVGRFKDGVTLEQARADMAGIAHNLAVTYPNADKDRGIAVTPVKQEMVQNIKPFLLVLLAAVAFVLFIACVNVANLLLARSTGRAREFAIRAALGASQGRVVRQLLTESVLLSLVGGGLGLLLASWGTKAGLSILPGTLPRADDVSIDPHVLLFTVIVSLIAGILFGLAPALKTSSPDLHETLKEGGRGSSGVRFRTQNIFVIAEMALAVVLLVGAGLTIRTLVALWTVNPGFDPNNVVSFGVSFSPSTTRSPAAQLRASKHQFTEKIASIPGIRAVSLMDGAFPLDDENDLPFWLDGTPKPPTENQMPDAIWYIVGPGYLSVMHIPLLRGRFLTAQDETDTPGVCVIDENFARKYFPNQNPVGKRLDFDIVYRQLQIVGVVGHVKQFGLDENAKSPALEQLYTSVFQIPDAVISPSSAAVTYVARTEGPPDAFIGSIRNAIHEFNSQAVVFDTGTMNHIVSQSLDSRRFAMILLAIFAGLALVLASIGIYGVISYIAGQRAHEIGIRIALGAQRRDVLRIVLGHGVRLSLIGVAIGLAASAGLTRLMTKILYGVSSLDPLTFVCVAIILTLVALAACYIPARRAMRVDPMVALRYE